MLPEDFWEIEISYRRSSKATGKSYWRRYTYRRILPEGYWEVEISYRKSSNATGKSYWRRYTCRRFLPEGYRKILAPIDEFFKNSCTFLESLGHYYVAYLLLCIQCLFTLYIHPSRILFHNNILFCTYFGMPSLLMLMK